MYPILFNVGPVSIYGYGLMIAVGFGFALLVLSWTSKRDGLPSSRILDMAFWTVLAGVLSSRLLYVLIRIDKYWERPLDAIKLWEGGLTFYGGLIGGLIVGYFFVRRYKLPVWRTLDQIGPALAIGQGFGRIGCFLAGCCWGKATNVAWAVRFPPESIVWRSAPELRDISSWSNWAPGFFDFHLPSFEIMTVPIHPTQAYMAVSLFVMFGILMWFRKYRRYDGQLVLLYGLLHSTMRLIMESIRGDFFPKPVVFGLLSETQLVAILMMATSIILMFILSRRARKPAEVQAEG